MPAPTTLVACVWCEAGDVPRGGCHERAVPHHHAPTGPDTETPGETCPRARAVNLDGALMSAITAIQYVHTLAVEHSQANRTTMDATLEDAIGQLVETLRGVADVYEAILPCAMATYSVDVPLDPRDVRAKAMLAADDERSMFPSGLVGVGPIHDRDLADDPADDPADDQPGPVLRLVPRPHETLCPECGEPFAEGEWPFCASKANPEGHRRGTYGFRMR